MFQRFSSRIRWKTSSTSELSVRIEQKAFKKKFCQLLRWLEFIFGISSGKEEGQEATGTFHFHVDVSNDLFYPNER